MRHWVSRISLVLVLPIGGCGWLGQPARTVVLISLDGATPAGLARAKTPHIDALIAAGAASRNARTVVPYKTLPCHTSMLTGVGCDRHDIEQNHFTEPLPVPAVPTVFDRIDAAGLDALMITGKYKLLTFRSGHYAELGDVADVLERETRGRLPHFVFIHSAEPDLSGHAAGWMSPAYLDAIGRTDRMVGAVVRWLRAKLVWSRALIILTADHGGHDNTHDGTHPTDVFVPWIASGGAVSRRELPDELYVTDIAPTVLYSLGLPVPDGLDGTPITRLTRPARRERR